MINRRRERVDRGRGGQIKRCNEPGVNRDGGVQRVTGPGGRFTSWPQGRCRTCTRTCRAPTPTRPRVRCMPQAACPPPCPHESHSPQPAARLRERRRRRGRGAGPLGRAAAPRTRAPTDCAGAGPLACPSCPGLGPKAPPPRTAGAQRGPARPGQGVVDGGGLGDGLGVDCGQLNRPRGRAVGGDQVKDGDAVGAVVHHACGVRVAEMRVYLGKGRWRWRWVGSAWRPQQAGRRLPAPLAPPPPPPPPPHPPRPTSGRRPVLLLAHPRRRRQSRWPGSTRPAPCRPRCRRSCGCPRLQHG